MAFSIRRLKHIACVAALLAGATLFSACSQTTTPGEADPSPTPELSIAPQPPGRETDQPDRPTSETETPVNTPSMADVASGKVPAQDLPADDAFFDDAAFLGNSLVDGFRLYSGLKTCDVYASTSMTVLGAGDLVAQMPAGSYGKVYILLGINEIGYEADYFCQLYAGLLDKIEASQPEADIYIMSLTPVSQAKSAGGTFTMERINEYNATLLQLAEDRGLWFIDLVEAMADETGYLPADVTTDGVHFTADEYLVWLDYLRTHYAPGSYVPAPAESPSEPSAAASNATPTI